MFVWSILLRQVFCELIVNIAIGTVLCLIGGGYGGRGGKNRNKRGKRRQNMEAWD